MIRNFLRLFAFVRELESRIASAKEDVRSANVDAVRLGNECSELRAQVRSLDANVIRQASHLAAANDRAAAAEKRADDANRELVDVLKTAGDSLGLRLTGRRLFSKAPVEAPPAQEQRPPINVSSGAGKQFAGDVARRKTASLFERLAKQSGVIAEDANETEQKPN